MFRKHGAYETRDGVSVAAGGAAAQSARDQRRAQSAVSFGLVFFPCITRRAQPRSGSRCPARRRVAGEDAPCESIEHRVEGGRRSERLARRLSRARVVFVPSETSLLLENVRGCVFGIRGTRRARLPVCLGVLRGAAKKGDDLVDVARVEGRARLDEP